MSVTPADASIFFTFGWQGANKSENQAIQLVRLNFESAKSSFSVQIPETLSPTRPQKLSFTRLSEDNQETHPSILKVTIEKIRSLKLLACVAELESEVPLQLPENLETGRTYHLKLTSNDNSLSAALIKQDMAALKKAKDDLMMICFYPFFPHMGLSIFELFKRCPGIPTPSPSEPRDNVGPDAILKVINQLDPLLLLESMASIRPLPSPQNKGAFPEGTYELLGPDSIKNMFRLNLLGLLKDQASPETRAVIEELAEKYKNKITTEDFHRH